jgi:hypothetical protein
LFCQPARNSADDNGCDPAHLWIIHGSSPPMARFETRLR